MKVRLNYGQVAAGVYEAMEALDEYLGACGLDNSLLHLVRLRASQVNGCAYCLDMHWKDLRALGEAEQRLYSLDAWRECPYYTERERAALAWTEAVTLIADGHVPDAIYEAGPRALRREGAVRPDAGRRYDQCLEPAVDRGSPRPGNLPAGDSPMNDVASEGCATSSARAHRDTMRATNDGTVRVAGATLFYRVRGNGPLLLILSGGDGDADTTDALCDQLLDRYTVVTYDRRGLSRSTIDADVGDLQIATHSEDAHHLLIALSHEPAFVFGSSIGALIGLDLVARHPGAGPRPRRARAAPMGALAGRRARSCRARARGRGEHVPARRCRRGFQEARGAGCRRLQRSRARRGVGAARRRKEPPI